MSDETMAIAALKGEIEALRAVNALLLTLYCRDTKDPAATLAQIEKALSGVQISGEIGNAKMDRVAQSHKAMTASLIAQARTLIGG